MKTNELIKESKKLPLKEAKTKQQLSAGELFCDVKNEPGEFKPISSEYIQLANEDGSIRDYYDGDITIDDVKELVSLKGLPKHIDGNLSIQYCNNLQSLEGISTYIERTLDLSGLPLIPSLEPLKDTQVKDVALSKIPISSFRGLPNELEFLNIYSSTISSWEGFPQKVNTVSFHGPKQKIDWAAFLEHAGEIVDLSFSSIDNIDDIPVLGIARIKNLDRVYVDQKSEDALRAVKMLNKALEDSYPKPIDILEFQSELIEAGLGKQAKLK